MTGRTRTMIWGLGLLLLALVLVGCQPTADDAAETAVKAATDEPVGPEATVTETDDPVTPEAVESAPPVPSKAEGSKAEGAIVQGFTANGDPFIGDPAASVLLEDFSSYQCPYCAKFFRETYFQVMANYVETGQVRYVFRDFPLPSQPQSSLAAQAANCAGRTGGGSAYWAMHDRLFEGQREWSGKRNAADIFKGYAADLELDAAAFGECLTSEAARAQVEADAAEGRSRGVRGTPTFFINGQALVGAQPYTAFAQALDAALAKQTPAAGPPAATPTLAVSTPAPPTPATIAPADDALTLGDPNAPVTIVEFSDYQCPFCQRHFQQTWPQLKAEFVDAGRVRYVFKDFPITSLHPQAPRVHEAARCAGEQGAYWEMHDRLFEAQSEWSKSANLVAALEGYAAELGLDRGAFAACLDSGRWTRAVSADIAEGARLGVRGTPTFFINGYPFVGAQPYQVFQQAIQLAEQGKLGEALQSQP